MVGAVFGLGWTRTSYSRTPTPCRVQWAFTALDLRRDLRPQIRRLPLWKPAQPWFGCEIIVTHSVLSACRHQSVLILLYSGFQSLPLRSGEFLGRRMRHLLLLIPSWVLGFQGARFCLNWI